MKKTDPGFEHNRESRHMISEEHAHDPKRLVDHYRRKQSATVLAAENTRTGTPSTRCSSTPSARDQPDR